MLGGVFQSPRDSYNPDSLGKIRLLVIGPSGCGKSTLAHLIAEGSPPKHMRSTAGCHVHLKLIHYSEKRAALANTPALAGKDFFLELWDVGTSSRFESIRSLYYSDICGVILVYDLGSSEGRGGLLSAEKWAREVSEQGTFQVPFPEERAALNLGGLPVPYLIIGNKSDTYKPSIQGAKIQTASSYLSQIQGMLLQPLRNLHSRLTSSKFLSKLLKRAFPATSSSSSRRLHNGAPPPSTTTTTATNNQDSNTDYSAYTKKYGSNVCLSGMHTIHGHEAAPILHAAASLGKLDRTTVDDFLYQVLERRYGGPQLNPALASYRTYSKGHGASTAVAGSHIQNDGSVLEGSGFGLINGGVGNNNISTNNNATSYGHIHLTRSGSVRAERSYSDKERYGASISTGVSGGNVGLLSPTQRVSLRIDDLL